MIIAVYLVLINLCGFWVMGADKRRAQHHKWRISEDRLWLIAIVFGALGVWLGMQTFRHKTKHTSFQYGVPFLLVIEAVLIGIYYSPFDL
ncbi:MULTISPECIES: DUF1294 domain-containing protein [Bacillus]|jgi:uncharacterized membrane protein YsdA (DUF1294 family)|uniref:DUF1294 domain-containing protein n=1 Tax=Bacillus mojavensis TaxID=72360 RepID=A0AAP3CQ50_BACMO|nr:MULTISPECIES: DUF1294 domain-containing protein [Bacillus]MCC2928164.1 DUF1294 domain-containing protein [Bacillus sp. LBG-1-113]MCK8098623.1 DUF1294 domain-containing protein [Bacillus sp. 2CMS4F]MCY8106391.1 DUF1294 domain-containing protein [Bacillus mojavensis]MCY8482771.1 DUF1294 domain-containing protein [Bacillus mojavensis]MCY8508969.1 DUF1294 domain-containing protein [Bacillus mojavensis]